MTAFWHDSTKFDGSLHYRYAVEVIGAPAERLVTYGVPGGPVESHRGCWTANKHILSFFWLGRPYVHHIRWDDQWRPEFLYVDIATATYWNDRAAGYIDLDLDLILRHNATAIHLDDEDEFAAHRVRWSYPEELVQTCWSVVEEVRGLLTAGREPFAPSVYAWRPGKPLTF